MKTIILTLVLLSYAIFNYGQEDKRIPELDRQNTYNDSLKVIVDDTSLLDSARYMTLKILAPKIDEETLESGTLDKDVTHLRINVSGSEYKASLRSIDPNPTDLSSGSLSNIDYLYCEDDGTGDLEYITGSNLASSVKSIENLQDQAEVEALAAAQIITDVDNTFLQGISPSPQISVTLTNGGTTYGYLWACKLGRLVVGQVVFNGTTCNNLGMTPQLPWTPTGATNLYFGDLDGSSQYWIRIYSSGTIYLRNDTGTGYGANGHGFGFSFID